jgi:hypothetical protein
MKRILAVALVACGLQVEAQEIAGTILNARHEPLMAAVVTVYKNGVVKGDAATDYDGNYVLHLADTGRYDVCISYSMLDTALFMAVIVGPGIRSAVNASLSGDGSSKKVIAYKSPVPSRVAAAQINRKNGGIPKWGCVEEVNIVGHSPWQAKMAIRVLPDVPLMPVKLNDSRKNPTAYKMDRKELSRLPYTNVNDALTIFPGVCQQQPGAGLSVFGSR